MAAIGEISPTTNAAMAVLSVRPGVGATAMLGGTCVAGGCSAMVAMLRRGFRIQKLGRETGIWHLRRGGIALRNICNGAKHRILLTAAHAGCHISSSCSAPKNHRRGAEIGARVPKD